MDELVHHCVQELSFDGDLGCDVSRLRDFIVDFYAREASTKPQVVDDAFCAFVWSVVVQQPGVCIGTVPEGAHCEVYIAPQVSAKRKGKAKEGEDPEDNTSVASLVVIPDAAVRPLDDLKKEYGDGLRIAVDPKTSFQAITGSHIRPAKLTPMVYSCLQLVSRGREAGISVVDLSKKTGYDAKTCHYLVEKLVELGYIEKRKKSGVGSNLCIHKYFFERSATWKTVVAEESEANAIDALKAELDDEGGVDDVTDRAPSTSQITFDPIDLRHLSSTPLVRARVVKLLKNSPHNMHTTHNLLSTIGFANPNKTDRRFFATRLRELMAQGLIEKVQLPNVKRKGAMVTCLRLISPDEAPVNVARQSVPGPNDEDGAADQQYLKANISLHKQILDLVHSSGTQGVTLGDLASNLCNFDKRIIELLLSRMEKYPPPPHLSDLAIAQISETYGRERRFRYFTLPNYRIVAEREKLEVSSYVDIDLSHAGGFMQVNEDQFYEDEREFISFVGGHDSEQPASVRKTPKKKPTKNPILPDGTVKKGRPRKQVTIEEPVQKKGGKRKKKDVEVPEEVQDAIDDEQDKSPPTKRRRGRSSQAPHEAIEDLPEVVPPPSQPEETPDTVTKKKRGRPRKQPPPLVVPQEEPPTPTPARRRGRSAKTTLAPSPSENDTVDHVTSNVSMDVDLEVPIIPLVEQPPVLQQETLVDRSEPPPPPPMILTAFDGSEIPLDPILAAECLGTSRASTSLVPPLNENISAMNGSASLGQVLKRTLPDSSTPEPRAKRAKSVVNEGARSKANISQSRREKEILRVISDNGGISNISSKEFLEAHAVLVESLSKNGEQVSTLAGSRIDKRTVDATLKILESQGKIKLLSTIVPTSTGASRTVKVAYLPETSSEELNVFLSDLSKNPQVPQAPPPVKTLTTPMEYGGVKVKAPVILPSVVSLADRDTEPGGNAQRAEDLFRREEEVIRESLLTERGTLAQLYGFLPGKAARARELHLAVLRAFENGSGGVVSARERIIHLSDFCEDLPVATYCSIVSCLTHNEDLVRLMETSEGRQTPVSKLQSDLYNVLQSTRSRARSRILDLIEVLQALRLVIPLDVPNDGPGDYSVDPNGSHPLVYSQLDSEDTTSLRAINYWRFNTTAPLHLWAISETEPTYWKDGSVDSHAEGSAFWKDLENASTSLGFCENHTSFLAQGVNPPDLPLGIIRTLRRPSSWRSTYSLSWYQCEYLKQDVDKTTGDTPLQDSIDGETRITRLSRVISAPRDVVKHFFEREHERMVRDIEKARRKAKKSQDEGRTKERAEEKKLLAQRAQEAKQQREKDFDDMVRRVHPEPLKGSIEIRIRRVRNRFMQSGGTDLKKWESEVVQAVEEAKIAAKKVIIGGSGARSGTSLIGQASGSGGTGPSTHVQMPPPPPPAVIGNVPEKSVEDLIIQQGPVVAAKPKPTKKKKGKEKETEEDTTDSRRRHRFQWNKDYDELARDASAVIKARCRDGKRLDWSALEQVFPSVPRNSVRQRITGLKALPGAETYFKRLEDKFYELWVRHRGTEVLPDEDPESVSNFNMVLHVKFLRNHVDKNALRVGFLESEQAVTVPLPTTIEEFESKFKVVEKSQSTPPWDFLWTLPSEEAREKSFIHEALTIGPSELPPLPTYPSEKVYLADAALKMALGTPTDKYDSEAAALMLKGIGEQNVKMASTELLDRGVLTKLVRDPSKPKPGRTLRISDANQNMLGGSLPRDLFSDAISFDELLSQPEPEDGPNWREWSLLAVDGDAAALIELVSENKVEFRVDTTHTQAARSTVDWNSKKADDDDIETSIQVRLTNSARPSPPQHPTTSPEISSLSKDTDIDVPMQDLPPVCTTTTASEMTTESAGTHGKTVQGDLACCRKVSVKGLVDCIGCLAARTAEVLRGMSEEEVRVARAVLGRVEESGGKGVARHVLFSDPSLVGYAPLVVSKVIDVLSVDDEMPLVFWTGYNEVVLVSCAYLKEWSVAVFQDEERVERVFPRRWLDIRGMKLMDVWEAGLRAVMGLVLFHPGISQTEIRWRLKPVYDRQEINDLLGYLSREGYLVKSKNSVVSVSVSGCADDSDDQKSTRGLADDREEIVWRVGAEKRWYQV